MKKSVAISVLSFVFVVQSAYILTGDETEDELKAMVDTIGGEAEKCFLAGDVNAMLQYYCDDIISMPNLHPMVRGKSNLKLMTEAIIALGMKFEYLESTTIEAKSCGDYVYEIGTFRQAIIMPGTSKPAKQTGKYVTIWKKQSDGQLKIAVEIYNSDENPYQNMPKDKQTN